MTDTELNANTDRFMRTFCNLPLAERKNPIVVLDEYGPISWFRAYKEIINSTAVSSAIMKKLIDMDLI
jgi:hypothetical protein